MPCRRSKMNIGRSTANKKQRKKGLRNKLQLLLTRAHSLILLTQLPNLSIQFNSFHSSSLPPSLAAASFFFFFFASDHRRSRWSI